MLVRPRDFPQPEIFTLSIDAARLKAREIICQFTQSGLPTVVEGWRQLPDGQIEFAVRRIPRAERQ